MKRIAPVGLLVVLSSSVALAASAPWEPSISVRENQLVVRRVRAAATVKDRIEILQAEACPAAANGLAVTLPPGCAFLQGAYFATLRGPKDGKSVEVAFPFAVHRSGAGFALLQDEAEVIDGSTR